MMADEGRVQELDKRRKAYEFGEYAEEMVAAEYVKRGYAILERQWRMGKTEIDIIARREDEIILVEVKGRKGDKEDALMAVTVDKRKRMIRAADAYLQKVKGNCSYRFDIAAFTGTKEDFNIEILEDAFVAADIF